MNFSITSEPNFKDTHKQAVQKQWFIYFDSLSYYLLLTELWNWMFFTESQTVCPKYGQTIHLH